MNTPHRDQKHQITIPATISMCDHRGWAWSPSGDLGLSVGEFWVGVIADDKRKAVESDNRAKPNKQKQETEEEQKANLDRWHRIAQDWQVQAEANKRDNLARWQKIAIEQKAILKVPNSQP